MNSGHCGVLPLHHYHRCICRHLSFKSSIACIHFPFNTNGYRDPLNVSCIRWKMSLNSGLYGLLLFIIYRCVVVICYLNQVFILFIFHLILTLNVSCLHWKPSMNSGHCNVLNLHNYHHCVVIIYHINQVFAVYIFHFIPMVTVSRLTFPASIGNRQWTAVFVVFFLFIIITVVVVVIIYGGIQQVNNVKFFNFLKLHLKYLMKIVENQNLYRNKYDLWKFLQKLFF